MTQAGLSTLFCVAPLVLLESYPPLVFLKAIFLVILLGLIHGLYLLPVLLSVFPTCMTGGGCCVKTSPKHRASIAQRASLKQDEDGEDILTVKFDDGKAVVTFSPDV